MIGTLVGLVNMLEVMDAGDLEVIGPRMAVALLTTFYGILLANLVFKPIAEARAAYGRAPYHYEHGAGRHFANYQAPSAIVY